MISLGCPKNLVDSEVMLGLAQRSGHELTRDAADADVLVVNTCAFIDKAKQESIDAILEMAELKKTGRCRQLVVTGCMARALPRRAARREIPEIDVVLGTGEVPEIVRALGGAAAGGPAGAVSGLLPHAQPRAAPARERRARRTPNPDAGPRTAAQSLPTYIYDARHAPPAGDATALRLRQDRRGVRLQVRVLHHPDAARQLPQPAGRVDRP